VTGLPGQMRWLALAALLAAGCATARPAAPADHDPIVNAPRRPGKPVILLAMPDAPSFRLVRTALIKEIKRDFDVVTLVIDGRTPATDFATHVDHVRPSCAVLLDTAAVKLIHGYQQSHPAARQAPAVVMMASFLEEAGAALENSSGIAWEIPAVTSLVNLRSVIDRPVARVGVIHRPAFRAYLARQKTLAAGEQIALVPAEVPAAPTAADVRAALKSFAKGVDALWVLNDEELLRDERFREEVWRPELAALGIPVVVGSASLVSAEARFGTFAVAPDLDALSVQAAELLYEIAEDDWNTEDHPMELPVSTVTVVNMRQVRKSFGLRKGALERIDKAVE
jgi:hypothetical protein